MSTGVFDMRMGEKNEGKSQTHQHREEGERNQASVQKEAPSGGVKNQEGEGQVTNPPTPKCVLTFDQLCETVIGTTNTHLMIRDIFCIYTDPAKRLCTDHLQRAFMLNEGVHVVGRRDGEG